jgi:hypothetical protein
MTLKYRHVRAEWQQFVEWPYKKVSTLCGVKTAAHNAGIPGITDNEAWCQRCAVNVHLTVEGLDNQPYMTNDAIRTLYSQAWMAVQPAVAIWRESRRQQEERMAAAKAARILEKA